MRTIEELERSAKAVIDLAFSTPATFERKGKGGGLVRREVFADFLAPLFSGGHDSACAVHLASRHPKFTGEVFHINTGIGTQRTRQHVEDTCKLFGWKLTVLRSKSTYEEFIRERGFPGPAMHQRAYIRLKDRCIRMIVKGRRVALITGCRSQESERRMGHVQPLKIGEIETHTITPKKGEPYKEEKVVNKNRYWVAPCHDWSVEEQRAYMEHHDIPANPVKLDLGMSGECFCGAFAAPGELERIRRYAPDVAAEIDRLTQIASDCGKHDRWGTRPPKLKGVIVAETGPLCSSCDIRAAHAGVVVKLGLDKSQLQPTD